MIKKKFNAIIPLMFSFVSIIGCKNNPSPTPKPISYPIDFDFSPTKDDNITVEKDKQRQVKIAFKDSSYKNNYKSITWEIDDESTQYISKVSEASDHMSYTFSANEVTPELTPALLTVTIVNKDESITKKKTCHISVDPKTYPVDFDFTPSSDSKVTVDKESSKKISIAFKDSSYESNVKTIEWNINPESSSYISKKSEDEKHMWFEFKADNITDTNPAELSVKVTPIEGNPLTKTCYIDVCNPCEDQTLIHEDGYYSYLKEGTIPKGTRYRFTSTRITSYNFTFFGMSKYSGDTPYFDIGIKDKDKTVNVTKISLDNGTTIRELNYGQEAYKYKYSDDMIVVTRSLFPVGTKIIIECTITKDLTEGMWAYIGSYGS